MTESLKPGIGCALAFLLALAPVAVFAQMPEGFEMVRLTEFGTYSRPDINNRSEVIWSCTTPPDVSDLFLFKAGIIRQLTDETYYEHRPSINVRGDYAYARTTDFFGLSDVVLSVDGTSIVFDSANASQQPDLNDSGQVVWQDRFSEDASDIRVFLFDGAGIQQISGRGTNFSPRINNRNQIVFAPTDTTAPGNPSTIILYDSGVPTALTDNAKSRIGPRINDLSQIVWFESDLDGLNDKVMLWQDGMATSFLEQDGLAAPSINNVADITYNLWNDSMGWWELWLYRAADKSSIMIPNQGFSHAGGPVGMNECQELTWLSFLPGGVSPPTVFLLRRTAPHGDFNHDCHIDAYDLAILENCFTGRNNGPADGLLGDCTRADFDNDVDVDEDDVGAFMKATAGPDEAIRDCQVVEDCGS